MRKYILILAGLSGVGASAVEAQTRTLAGRVTDLQTGRPVSVGQVFVKGADIKDEIRPDGVFVLRVPATDVILVVRSKGYRPREVRVPATLNTAFIQLRADGLELDRMVITGRATATGRRNLPTSTATLGGEELDRVPATSVTQAFQGKVAGADVQQNSGVPGGDLQLSLRGVTTLFGSVSPLYIVDGVIISNASIASGAGAVTGGQQAVPGRIVDLNQHDIERIEILKGSAAAAMYGSKGSNGVVIITTKRGRRRTP